MNQIPHIQVLPIVPSAGVAPPGEGPLTEMHFARIRVAMQDRAAIRGISRVSAFSAVSMLVIGVLSLPFTLFPPDWVTLIVAAICGLGVVEWVGHKRVRRAERSGAILLACNQLALLAVIIAYCVGQIMTIKPQTLVSPEASQLLAGMPELNGVLSQATTLAKYFYGLVAVVSAACQGGLAWYYFIRRKHIERFAQQTPVWIQRLMNELGV